MTVYVVVVQYDGCLLPLVATTTELDAEGLKKRLASRKVADSTREKIFDAWIKGLGLGGDDFQFEKVEYEVLPIELVDVSAAADAVAKAMSEIRRGIKIVPKGEIEP